MGARSYTVQWYSEAQAQARRCRGEHNYDEGWMRFDDTLDGEMLATVALHELCHAVYLLSMPPGLRDELEEDVVDMFTKGLAGAIHQNPQLFRSIVRKLK